MDEKIKAIADKTNEYYDTYSAALTEGQAQRAFNYGNQWDESAQEKLKANGMPDSIQNEISKHQKAFLAEFADNSPQLEVKCTDLNVDEKLVDIYRQLIDDINIRSRQDNVFDDCMENALRTGCGGFAYVYTDFANEYNFQQEIFIKSISFTDGFFDPDAQHLTRKDAEYCGYFVHMDKEIAQKKYKDIYIASYDNPFSAFANYNAWNTTKTIALCHFFEKVYFKKTLYLTKKMGEIYRTIEKGDKLEKGESICKERIADDFEIKGSLCSGVEILEEKTLESRHQPVIYFSGYQAVIDGTIQPYSYGYDVQDLQRLKNITLSQLSSMIMNIRKEQLFVNKKAVMGEKDTITALKNPMRQRGAFIINGEPGVAVQRFSPPELPTTLLGTYQDLSTQIDATLGRYDAQQGAPNNGQSGYAESLRIGQGNIASYFYIKNIMSSLLQVSVIVAELIPSVYLEKRTVALNDKSHVINNFEGNEEEENDIGSLNPNDFKIKIKPGASFEVKRQKYLQTLVELTKSLPPQAQAVLLPNLLELMELPNAQEINRKLEAVIAINMPDVYKINKGEDAEQLLEAKAQQQPQQSPEMIQQQQQAQIAQQEQQMQVAKLKLAQEELDLKKRKQSMDELTAYGTYQINAEKNDTSDAESKSKIEAAQLKSHAEIVKAIMEMKTALHQHKIM